MRCMLDTHAFIWLVSYPEKLSRTVVDMLQSPSNEFYLSAVSGWEIAIKTHLGRLQLPDMPDRFVPEQLAENRVSSLPVLMSHALHVANLPDHHRDTFDRRLVAQAQLEDLPILTADPDIARYDVKIFGRDL